MHDLELNVGFSLIHIGNHRTVLEVELVSFQDDKTWFVFDCELDGETPIRMLMKSIIAVKVKTIIVP